MIGEYIVVGRLSTWLAVLKQHLFALHLQWNLWLFHHEVTLTRSKFWNYWKTPGASKVKFCKKNHLGPRTFHVARLHRLRLCTGMLFYGTYDDFSKYPPTLFADLGSKKYHGTFRNSLKTPFHLLFFKKVPMVLFWKFWKRPPTHHNFWWYSWSNIKFYN